MQHARKDRTNRIQDPGNYKAGAGYSYAVFAAAAAEFGDKKIKKEFLERVDNELYPAYTTETGARRNKNLSTIGQATVLRARIGEYQDWHNMLNVGPDSNALRGPLLADASFPDVLVAKAYSHDGLGLDLVLYNGKKPGKFALGLERMIPGATYKGQNGQSFTADENGRASIPVEIDGRTQVLIERAS